ncbi:MAG TPA: GTPase ObgE [Solirubrobacteraceae bacterium]|jgi:GTP-binding protein|nr:GTPase ObgE [Solirubrobacteraceae bacterium]
MLHDRARIHVQAGAGGDGSTSFRREAHVPRGGPDGGDGGHGGAVVLVCDESLRDLQEFRRKAHYRAGRGGHGEGAQRHGADGRTLEIGVPPGTQISAPAGDGQDLAGRRWELLADGQRATVARGGPGGKGNKRFATPTRQAPRFAERGLAGEEGWLELRLKLLADVGLVGLPNAGKSSLLARLTRAAPKVADYPFTTLSPVLGVLEGDDRQLVLADIPGLIEGASDGAGLGHDFLAHVERTRLLVHVLDVAPQLSGEQDADAVANHATIERELAAHDERLSRLPRILALSKCDLLDERRVREAVAAWRARLGEQTPVIATSSATGAGLGELASELLRRVPALAGAAGGEDVAAAGALETGAGVEQLAEHMVFRPAGASGFQVERIGPRAFAVRGRGIERLLARYDVENEDAMAHFEERLRRIGVLRALQAEGFQPGDEIEIAGSVFELDPDA